MHKQPENQLEIKNFLELRFGCLGNVKVKKTPKCNSPY
jgi:hypothetical protein